VYYPELSIDRQQRGGKAVRVFPLYRVAAAGLFPLIAIGCEPTSENPVVFGQGTTVGISIGQSPTTQAPEFVLGYKDVNIALLPTTATDAAGEVITLGGQSGADANGFSETYSVLGQFDLNTPTQVGAGVAGLGKFFATGLAAQKLSAGFACAISDGRDMAHCHAPTGSGGGQTN
jgi:hypothetical protein